MRLLFRASKYFSNTTTNNPFAQYSPSFVKLDNRSIIIVNGQETRKFLQGLTTNNISALYEPRARGSDKIQNRVSIYSLFLNPKGKIITDAIIFRPISYFNGQQIAPEDQLWIDVPKTANSILFEHLRKYTWKKNVALFNSINQDDKPSIYAGFNKLVMNISLGQLQSKAGHLLNIQSKNKLEYHEDQSYANIAFFDPRGIKFGVRLVCGPDGFQYQGKTQKSNLQQYQKICRLNGASSSQVMTNKLPFMFNSDIFNGFSFKKGCYLGQQIVARSYFTGIVRRRIFPYILEENKKLQVGQSLFNENKVQLGKVLQSYNGYGTIQCNYLPLLNQKWPIVFSEPAKGLVNNPFQQQLQKYINDIKAKQAKLQQIDL